MMHELHLMGEHEHPEIHEAIVAFIENKNITPHNFGYLSGLMAGDVLQVTVDVQECEGLPDGPMPVLLSVSRRHIVAEGPKTMFMLEFLKDDG